MKFFHQQPNFGQIVVSQCVSTTGNQILVKSWPERWRQLAEAYKEEEDEEDEEDEEVLWSPQEIKGQQIEVLNPLPPPETQFVLHRQTPNFLRF
jgi:hypothetical protein